MLSIAYASSATSPFSDDDIAALLAKSRVNNVSLGLTGALLYRDGRFVQVIEGPDDQVRTKFVTIGSDPRHRNISLVSEESITERQFPEWTMGYRPLTETAMSLFPGYDDFFAGRPNPSTPPGTAPQAQDLLVWLRDYWLS